MQEENRKLSSSLTAATERDSGVSEDESYIEIDLVHKLQVGGGGAPWCMVEDHGAGWRTMVGHHGAWWRTMLQGGPPWCTVEDHGARWRTMVHGGGPWCTIGAWWSTIMVDGGGAWCLTTRACCRQPK